MMKDGQVQGLQATNSGQHWDFISCLFVAKFVILTIQGHCCNRGNDVAKGEGSISYGNFK